MGSKIQIWRMQAASDKHGEERISVLIQGSNEENSKQEETIKSLEETVVMLEDTIERLAGECASLMEEAGGSSRGFPDMNQLYAEEKEKNERLEAELGQAVNNVIMMATKAEEMRESHRLEVESLLDGVIDEIGGAAGINKPKKTAVPSVSSPEWLQMVTAVVSDSLSRSRSPSRAVQHQGREEMSESIDNLISRVCTLKPGKNKKNKDVASPNPAKEAWPQDRKPSPEVDTDMIIQAGRRYREELITSYMDEGLQTNNSLNKTEAEVLDRVLNKSGLVKKFRSEEVTRQGTVPDFSKSSYGILEEAQLERLERYRAGIRKPVDDRVRLDTSAPTMVEREMREGFGRSKPKIEDMRSKEEENSRHAYSSKGNYALDRYEDGLDVKLKSRMRKARDAWSLEATKKHACGEIVTSLADQNAFELGRNNKLNPWILKSKAPRPSNPNESSGGGLEFDELDSNRDGVLSREEFARANEVTRAKEARFLRQDVVGALSRGRPASRPTGYAR